MTAFSKPGPAFPFAEFEAKWQTVWEDARIFHSEPSRERRNWVVVELPPFANGALHLGHVRNYVMGDVSARYRRMAGWNVLYTSGFDSFGLPNELAAIEADCHPRVLAERIIPEMRRDFVRLGLSHDTRRVMGYHAPEFYRWVQWVFLRLFENGLAYRKPVPAFWCPRCELTLADSLAESGQCWRCRTPVEVRTLDQWMVRESEFAEELLQALPRLRNWPEKIKRIHADWIGRKSGADLEFRIEGAPEITFAAFLPEPALLPAVAIIAVAPEHPLVEAIGAAGLMGKETAGRLAEMKHRRNAGDFVRRSGDISKAEMEPLGIRAEHPLLTGSVPLVVFGGLDLRSNDGLLVLCPAHSRGDARLGEAAGIAAPPLLHRPGADATDPGDPFHWEDGWCYASGDLAGCSVAEGRKRILERLVETGSGMASVRYRLRDWSIARQRYWGPPVPVIHCRVCGPIGVPDDQLPVRLPDKVDLLAPNPLAGSEEFVNAECPKCGGSARRDTDTLEAYSSPWWYHWNCKGTGTFNPFDKDESRLYMPVNLMIGGEDQARTCFFHARMVAHALKRLGILEHDEPIAGLLAIGMVKAGQRKMSKSEGNAADPRPLVESFGADALRLAVLAAAAPENELNWSSDLVTQAHSFLNSIWNFFEGPAQEILFSSADSIDTGYSLSRKLAHQLQTATARTTRALEDNLFHLAAQNLKFLFERIEGYHAEAIRRRKTLDERDRGALAGAGRAFLIMLAPLCPHIAEEIWHRRGGGCLIAQASWPVFAESEGGSNDAIAG